jgi:hypothetical protein
MKKTTGMGGGGMEYSFYDGNKLRTKVSWSVLIPTAMSTLVKCHEPNLSVVSCAVLHSYRLQPYPQTFDWLAVPNTLAYCGTEYISVGKYIVIQPPGAESTTTFVAVCILIVQSVATASGLRCPSTDLYYKYITIVNGD